ncbi:MAG: S8 family serine peptidase, partial [bacterium]|nr:S8 family serine peptidase [bacterium]
MAGLQILGKATGKEQDLKDILLKSNVSYIEPDYTLHLLATSKDPFAPQQWSLFKVANGTDFSIQVNNAWKITKGNENVIVGLVDTGVDTSHPDLLGRIWQNTNEIPDNNIDDDNNGIVDDIAGYNSTNDSGQVTDRNGHGTHVAGIIAANHGNGLGITGIAPGVKLLPLKFMDSNGFGSVSGAIKAINYAIEMKHRGVPIRVLNNSWGTDNYSHALYETIKKAGEAGILVVAASGNSSSDNDVTPIYPASYDLPNLISVAASDSQGNLSRFSSYGKYRVALAAPGENILSTYPGDEYKYMSGTSMAAPHVTAVAALLFSYKPHYTPEQTSLALVATAKKLPQLKNMVSGDGLLNAEAALTDEHTRLVGKKRVRYATNIRPVESLSIPGSLLITEDETYSVVELPFPFHYYGVDFDRLTVSANGRVIPGQVNGGAKSDFSNHLSSGINPFHDDIFTSSQCTTSKQCGVWLSTMEDSVTLTWVGPRYRDRKSSNQDDEIRVQLVIRSSGEILFSYLGLQGDDELERRGKGASIGLVPPPSSWGETVVISEEDIYAQSDLEGKTFVFHRALDSIAADQDRDGSSDLIVWRPSGGMWFINSSSRNFEFSTHTAIQLGLPGDVPLTADFDGDLTTDLSVWRPDNGTWYFRLSGDSFQNISAIQWGLPGDIPFATDLEGDGRADLVVYRPSEGNFYIRASSASISRITPPEVTTTTLGGPEFDPLVGRVSEYSPTNLLAVWQPLRFWAAKEPGKTELNFNLPWGEPGDTIKLCDFDGDGVMERTVVRLRPDLRLDWYGIAEDGRVFLDNFGSIGDTPLCNLDFDGDGTPDRTVFRNHTGEWIF